MQFKNMLGAGLRLGKAYYNSIFGELEPASVVSFARNALYHDQQVNLVVTRNESGDRINYKIVAHGMYTRKRKPDTIFPLYDETIIASPGQRRYVDGVQFEIEAKQEAIRTAHVLRFNGLEATINGQSSQAAQQELLHLQARLDFVTISLLPK